MPRALHDGPHKQVYIGPDGSNRLCVFAYTPRWAHSLQRMTITVLFNGSPPGFLAQ